MQKEDQSRYYSLLKLIFNSNKIHVFLKKFISCLKDGYADFCKHLYVSVSFLITIRIFSTSVLIYIVFS
jgi:hypothetical protein